MSAKNNNAKPLPLSNTLHDLAVLRASDIDLAAFLPAPSSNAEILAKPDGTEKSTAPNEVSAANSQQVERDRLVEKSYEYVREGRAAIRLLRRGDVDTQDARVEIVRSELEEILHGLSGLEDK